jgi:hypothetical protein
LIPMGLQRFGIDPALALGAAQTTATDAAGFVFWDWPMDSRCKKPPDAGKTARKLAFDAGQGQAAEILRYFGGRAWQVLAGYMPMRTEIAARDGGPSRRGSMAGRRCGFANGRRVTVR